MTKVTIINKYHWVHWPKE